MNSEHLSVNSEQCSSTPLTNNSEQLTINNQHKRIGIAVICDDQGLVLIDRRREQGLFGGFWEFPGGKIKPEETVAACIKREILEEIGIEIEIGNHLITIEHDYTHFRVTLIVHNCRYLSGEPQTIECEEIRWVSLDEIEQFSFPEANRKIIAALRDALCFP